MESGFIARLSDFRGHALDPCDYIITSLHVATLSGDSSTKASRTVVSLGKVAKG